MIFLRRLLSRRIAMFSKVLRLLLLPLLLLLAAGPVGAEKSKLGACFKDEVRELPPKKRRGAMRCLNSTLERYWKTTNWKTTNPGPGLTVLIDLVFNNNAIVNLGDSQPHRLRDPRFKSFIAVARELQRRGHRVLLSYTDDISPRNEKAAHMFRQFPRADIFAGPHPDCAVLWSNFNAQVNRYPVAVDLFQRRRVPYVVYENGMIKGAVTVDPRGLLGDSFYLSSLNDRVQREYDAAACSLNVASKRPQLNSTDYPARIKGHFVFIPTQKFEDVSVRKFSTTTYPQLIERVLLFCIAQKLPLVLKIHPHLCCDERAAQETLIRHMKERHRGMVYESRSSIHLLTSQAKFTVTLNGGTLMDNFISQSPVLTVARSMFQETDAVVFNTDVGAFIAQSN